MEERNDPPAQQTRRLLVIVTDLGAPGETLAVLRSPDERTTMVLVQRGITAHDLVATAMLRLRLWEITAWKTAGGCPADVDPLDWWDPDTVATPDMVPPPVRPASSVAA
ncbi:hypothetical protein GCM10027294_43400 [Marinactinospora endophytica]